MAKYIDADKLIAEIERQKHELELSIQSQGDYGQSCHIVAYDNILSLINSLQQEQPKLTQVPYIEKETQKKGWLDYGLLISEIGLHRSNAIDRIKETKELATEIKRNVAPHDLAILSEYLESAGAEIVLCCLQRYCMDSMFTQDEVDEILQQEQPEVDIVTEYDEKFNFDPVYGKLTNRSAGIAIARHFYELGLNVRKEE